MWDKGDLLGDNCFHLQIQAAILHGQPFYFVAWQLCRRARQTGASTDLKYSKYDQKQKRDTWSFTVTACFWVWFDFTEFTSMLHREPILLHLHACLHHHVCFFSHVFLSFVSLQQTPHTYQSQQQGSALHQSHRDQVLSRKSFRHWSTLLTCQSSIVYQQIYSKAAASTLYHILCTPGYKQTYSMRRTGKRKCVWGDLLMGQKKTHAPTQRALCSQPDFWRR